MAGRPSIYTEELGKEICDWIANNAAGLRTGCSKHDHWPEYSVIRRWLRNNDFPEFSNLYARAHEDKSETMGEDIIIIADSPAIDPNDKRVRIDARKWLMGKLKPKKYGERINIDHSGEIKNITKFDPSKLTDAEQLELIRLADKGEVSEDLPGTEKSD